jgi:putative ABC transport system permease protein
MIRHTFKLIWSRKRRNFLLISEIFLAFVVMFAVASTVITGLVRYMKPLGFSYRNTWVLHLHAYDLEKDLNDDDIRATLAQIRQEMEAQPEVGRVSFVSSNYAYSRSRWTNILKKDEQEYYAAYWQADDNFREVMGLNLLEGRWFSPEDDASPARPIVITRQLKADMFGDESPFQTVQSHKGDERVVVGVVDTYNYRGEFENAERGYFERHPISDTASRIPYEAVFSVREGSGARVEERILKRLAGIAPGWNLRIETMTEAREHYLQDNILGVGIFVTIAGFMVFNVALGLFGVLWQSISRRHGEVGLRRAVGASRRHVAVQILLESLALATLAIVIGCLVAVQVPLLGLDIVVTGMDASVPGGVYVMGMVWAALLIYLLVSACALYPSQLAARVEPAAALHED